MLVTALGISKSARKLGYATTKIGGDLLSVAKESNVAYSLEGRVSGLNISGVNSGPGGSARILIRGITSFTSSTGRFISGLLANVRISQNPALCPPTENVQSVKQRSA